jgi:hypothetical protein
MIVPDPNWEWSTTEPSSHSVTPLGPDKEMFRWLEPFEDLHLNTTRELLLVVVCPASVLLSLIVQR